MTHLWPGLRSAHGGSESDIPRCTDGRTQTDIEPTARLDKALVPSYPNFLSNSGILGDKIEGPQWNCCSGQYQLSKSGSRSSYVSMDPRCTTSPMPLTKSYAWFLLESRGFDNLYAMAGSGYGLECWGFDTAPTGHTLRLISFSRVIENSLGELLRSNQISPFINQVAGLPGIQEFNADEVPGKLEGILPVIQKVNKKFKNPIWRKEVMVPRTII
nr:uncharacterized protein LOC128688511 [Cherax quadricarinatus]